MSLPFDSTSRVSICDDLRRLVRRLRDHEGDLKALVADALSLTDAGSADLRNVLGVLAPRFAARDAARMAILPFAIVGPIQTPRSSAKEWRETRSRRALLVCVGVRLLDGNDLRDIRMRQRRFRTNGEES